MSGEYTEPVNGQAVFEAGRAFYWYFGNMQGFSGGKAWGGTSNFR